MAFVHGQVGVAGPEANPAHSEAQCRAGYGALAWTKRERERQRPGAIVPSEIGVAGPETNPAHGEGAGASFRRGRVGYGALDGIETGVRQLIRDEPLETTIVDIGGVPLTIPTEAEILRIKGILILRRNATRDYLDFAALADRMGDDAAGRALRPFDVLYRQDNGQSPLQQLQAQLANALPYDLDETSLSEYRDLAPRWHDWNAVTSTCARIANATFEHVCDSGAPDEIP